MRGEDYYSEGMLIWLEVDAKLTKEWPAYQLFKAWGVEYTPVVLHACGDIACRIRGGEKLFFTDRDKLQALAQSVGLPPGHGVAYLDPEALLARAPGVEVIEALALG